MQTAGYEYNGKELIDVVLRPLFIGAIPEGLTVIYTDGAGSVKQTLFNSGGHNLVKYADGFQGGNASLKKQKKFELGEFKAENTYSKQDYANIIQNQASDLKKAFQNDIFKREYMNRFAPKFKTDLEKLSPKVLLLTLAELQIMQNGVDIGIFNNYWLGDKNKITFDTGTFPNKTIYAKYDDDIRFNVIDGVWTRIFTDASLTPTLDEIQKIDMTNGAVAQIETITLSGTSGTAYVTAKGLIKLVTFNSDLATTASDFVTANSAAYLLKDLVLTSSGADLIFTSLKKGLPFDSIAIINDSGDLTGSVAATMANTKASAMSADEAMAKMDEMIEAQGTALSEIDDDKKVIWATNSWIRNYKKTLGVAGANLGTSETARKAMVEGLRQLEFNGIPVLKMPIDSALSAYFDGYSPHRAILSVPVNYALILSSAGKFGESTLWWNKDENQNRTRTQLEFGGDYFLPELMVAAFQD